MSAVTELLCSTFLFVVFACADQKTITSESGQKVTLTCRAPNNNIIVVKWNRTDLGDKYVLFYQDEQFDPDMQHPSFKNRVDLQDRQMKDGDVSLILKNVTTADSGTYKCYVVQRVREPLSLISIINLIIYPDPKNITAESGQNVTLPCRVTNDNNKIIAVEWSRPDLGNKHVLLYQDGHFDPYYHNERFDLDHQHPSFKNRVDLQDRQMKDGDVSLILKNVTINDTGTYECRVFMEETRSWKNSITGTINLTVVFPPGQRGGDTENRFVGLIVSGLLIAVAGFLFCFVLKKTVKVS
ncbi:T-cell surface protein tactile-like isoform X2 [Oreochromis niloticus]|uniref:T-cell surface protein tactile-like isoform X2 n=1 Tax=Oreochromis niloticus TaxID=8128 RepID=UPI000905BBE3|nr:T-cell surface protein tactile-like isoform X2 [Oreochromis niloticus]CAI5671354.1 unnamed protein product [Mustela putorius furo]